MAYAMLTYHVDKMQNARQTRLMEVKEAEDAFLAKLGEKLASPTPEYPTAECWLTSNLFRLFREIRDELKSHNIRFKLSNEATLEWLSRINIEKTIATEGKIFHLLDLGASAQSLPDPLDLLMASHPQGVVCYWTAVAFHELTTQITAHHHVAKLITTKSIPQSTKTTTRPAGPSDAPGGSTERTPSLGQLLFRFEGTTYYLTERVAHLVPGVQIRAHGPKTLLRITTLEQTLLDCLYKAHACGGPDVVFEAWKNAFDISRLDEERVADYLKRMNYPATSRRVGAMFAVLGKSPGAELQNFLRDEMARIDRTSRYATISLLPGFAYPQLDQEWLVRIP
jgi:predicted transcriptional regulator of viral defense system